MKLMASWVEAINSTTPHPNPPRYPNPDNDSRLVLSWRESLFLVKNIETSYYLWDSETASLSGFLKAVYETGIGVGETDAWVYFEEGFGGWES